MRDAFRQRLGWTAVFGAWLILVILPILIEWSRHCFSNYDLGIYTQALSLIRWDHWNPWLSVREIRVFNDHFDPILLWVAPWVRGSEPTLRALIIEFGFVLAAAILIWKHSRPLLFPTAFFLLGSATTTALGFPVHPGTWAVFPLTGLLISLQNPEAGRTSLLWAAFLLMFKEEYVPVLAVLALSRILFQKRLGVQLLLLALAWGIGVFYLRPRLLGSTESYTEGFLAFWLQDPIHAAKVRLLDWGIWRGLGAATLPALVWIGAAFAQRSTPAKPLVRSDALFVFLSLLGIRFVSGRWGHHYWIPLAACLALLIPPRFKVERRWAVASWILLIAFQLSYLGKSSLKTLFRGGPAHCAADPERLQELEQVSIFLEGRPSATVVAPNALIPRLITSERTQLHPLENARELPDPPFWLLTQVHPSAKHWPTDGATTQARALKLREGRNVVTVLNGQWVRLDWVEWRKRERFHREAQFARSSL